MAVFKKANKIRKMKIRMKAYEKTNPKEAENMKGRIAALEGRKER